jgi:hypothetical protein
VIECAKPTVGVLREGILQIADCKLQFERQKRLVFQFAICNLQLLILLSKGMPALDFAGIVFSRWRFMFARIHSAISGITILFFVLFPG